MEHQVLSHRHISISYSLLFNLKGFEALFIIRLLIKHAINENITKYIVNSTFSRVIFITETHLYSFFCY